MRVLKNKSSLVQMRQLLHVGSGLVRQDRLPACFQKAEWRELRLDIDPGVKPDIIGSITDLSAIPSASIDAIWSSHNLEHIHSFEVPIALAEFKRVLKPHGFALITVPDLRAIARRVANDLLTETLYESPAGAISPLDVLFGHQASLAGGNHFMAHRTGFTSKTLGQSLLAADFSEARVHEGKRWDLWAIATMPQTSRDVFNELAEVML